MTDLYSPTRKISFFLPAVIGVGLALIAAQTFGNSGTDVAALRHCGDGETATSAVAVAQDGKIKVTEIAATREGTVSRMRAVIETDGDMAQPVAYTRCLPPI